MSFDAFVFAAMCIIAAMGLAFLALLGDEEEK